MNSIRFIKTNSSKAVSFFTILFFISLPALYSQKGVDDGSKYGHGSDSVECIKNLSLYREYIRQTDYVAAYPYWQLVFDNCPKASKNIYIDGAKMLRNKLNSIKDDDVKKMLIDTLTMIYERRIIYFGEKGEVRGRQGVDLLKYSGNDNLKNIQEAYGYLKESVQLEQNNVLETVLANYVSASLILYKNSNLRSGEVIRDYLIASELLNRSSDAKSNPELQNLRNSINDNFYKAGPADCDTLISYFTEELKTKKEDIDFLRVLTGLLRNCDCTKSSLFYNCSKKLHDIEPSSESALNVAILAYSDKRYQEAAAYYKQAAELETDESKKADYYYSLAVITNNLDNKTKAREYALKASSLKENWGDPYMLIGQMYADSKDLCGSISLPNAVFWVAVDMFNKAKSIDPSNEEKANRLIQTYSKYFPNTEDSFFLNVTEGNYFTIGCWINETTKARFNQ